MKKEYGITLIALVISIIVIIILAGVTINSLINNGIIDKAKAATQEYKNTQNYEETQIAKYTNDINNYVYGNRDYTQINYSLEEQDTGIKWLDNKNIYKKTLVYTDSNLLSTGYHQVDHNIDNIDSIIKISIMYLRNDGYFIPAPNGQTDLGWNTMNAGASKTKIDYNIGNSLTNNYAIKKIIIDIEYTKSTT